MAENQGDSSNYKRQSSNSENNKTLAIVDELKNLLQNQYKNTEDVSQAKIEFIVGSIGKRARPNSNHFQGSQRYDKAEFDLRVKQRCLAYGDSAENIRKKINDEEQKEEQRRRLIENELQQLIGVVKKTRPKKTLTVEKFCERLKTIEQDQFDQVYRMYYSQISRMGIDLSSKSDETISDQVLAIQISCFTSKDRTHLEALSKQKDFDSSYQCLMDFTRSMLNKSESQSASNTSVHQSIRLINSAPNPPERQNSAR